ncbi:MAG: hypothetical protein FWH46_04020 [Methanimicrococcus sp.]|nr:hypothetical protein [Methanimicrococcus sp.]
MTSQKSPSRSTQKTFNLTTNKETIAIIGAGAIGRGFLPWKMNMERYRLLFIDSNRELIETMNKNGGYWTFMVQNNRLEEKYVKIDQALHLSEISTGSLDNPAAVFMSVGPKNVRDASNCLKGVSCPIILCENDPKTVQIVRTHLNYDQVYFAVPDVITSNTASQESLLRDPLAIHSEDGCLFIDDRAGSIDGDISFLSEDELINKQWTAKLFLHNTPHCIAAYLGAMRGLRYIHDVMKYDELKKIVVGAMNEMLAVQKIKAADESNESDFLTWYAEKEISRFSNELLYDPISRVAREPYRKLEMDGRLIGAAHDCILTSRPFDNIMIGTVCTALCAYHGRTDISDIEFDPVSSKSKVLSVFSSIGLTGTVVGDAMQSKLDEALEKISEVVL